MIYLALFFFSVLTTYLMRWVSAKNAILDIPNERSSHTIAVPRGGGVAVIGTFYVGLFYFRQLVLTCV